MEVEGLYGRYNYRISPLSEEDAQKGAPPLMLIYGDNGCGKTTVLRLLWHLLSPADFKGHRSALAQIPFNRLRVRLGRGDTIDVQKKENIIGSYSVIVKRPGQSSIEQEYLYDEVHQAVIGNDFRSAARESMRRILGSNYRIYASSKQDFIDNANQIDEDAFTPYLQALKTRPFFLADDRRIHVDAEQPSGRSRHSGFTEDDKSEEKISSVAEELQTVIQRANEWLRQQLLSGTQRGSYGADTIYRQVLSHLAVSDAESTRTVDDLLSDLQQLGDRSARFSELGLAPRVSTDDFARLLDQIKENSRREAALSILAPYIEGQKARFDSLQPVEELIRTFIENVNRYLRDKRIHFTPAKGLRIRSQHGDLLTPAQLSSGERQLVLLLTNCLVARESASLFLIDEPELSLNVKWQRELIKSLLECVRGANVQFILATHSIEMVTRNRSYLAQLVGEHG
ncbi:ATP-binding protein [Acrocarpospora pleiomorpha]|uniref:ATP-binding protein n=1 Tax=Acrocarpospora pleiomorpha TaxID=90975 RepID=UPI001478796F|nr:ATP-binding protein [Acrocarpospora pleiomorpha]